LIKRGTALRSTTGDDVADEGLRFHDADVRLLADHKQIVNDVSRDVTAISPVIRQADLMNPFSVNP
jgi:hypothetical protein